MEFRLSTVLVFDSAALGRVLGAIALVTLGPMALATGTAQVTFVHPESFADAGRTVLERERTFKTLTDHLQQLASRLPAGQTLRVELLDVDLAGEQRSLRPNDSRVMQGISDWPRLRLRWSLLESGHTVLGGEDELSDMNYLTRGRTRFALDGELPYETRLLDRWFTERFSSVR